MNAAMTLILACVGIFGFFVLLFGFLLLFRYINYREKIKLAEKGIFPQEEPKQKPKKGLLIAGWIITILGFLGTIIFWLFGISVTGSGYGYGFPMGLGPWVLVGLFPMLFGLILLLIYVVRSPSKNGYQKEKQTVEMNLDPFHNDLASSSQNDQAPSDSDTNQ